MKVALFALLVCCLALTASADGSVKRKNILSDVNKIVFAMKTESLNVLDEFIEVLRLLNEIIRDLNIHVRPIKADDLPVAPGRSHYPL